MEEGKVIIAQNADVTKALGEEFVKLLKKGDIVSLSGPIGAGKTTFAQGVARGLGIKKRIISPTFVLVREYQGNLKGEEVNLYHIDLYRMEGERDVRNLGIGDLIDDKNGIILIEWAEKGEFIKLTYDIRFAIKGHAREIVIDRHE